MIFYKKDGGHLEFMQIRVLYHTISNFTVFRIQSFNYDVYDSSYVFISLFVTKLSGIK